MALKSKISSAAGRRHKKSPDLGELGGTLTQVIGASFWPRQEPKIIICLNYSAQAFPGETSTLAGASLLEYIAGALPEGPAPKSSAATQDGG